MITAERLQHLINQTPKTLTELVDKEGVEFCLSEFKGISNGGQFVYKVLYENDNGPKIGQVVLTWSSNDLKVEFK